MNEKVKKVLLLILLAPILAWATMEFTGPLVDLSSSWTTGRMAYTTTNADGYVQLDTLDDLTTFVAGTTNQITVTDDGDGSLTLSAPQDLATTSSPTFADVTLSSPSNIYALDHDSFAGFVANEHIDWTADQGATNISKENVTNLSDADLGDIIISSGSWSLDITGAAAVGTFESGDTFLVYEAGVGVREADYDDLPGASATAYDDIGDPDAAGSISFDDGETATYTGANEDEAFFNIILSKADLTADTTALKINAVDDDDENYIPLSIHDDSGGNDDILFQIDYTGAVETGSWKATAIAHEYGGLEADVSAYNGFVKISGGTTSAVTANAGTDITADLEEEVTEGSLADSTIVSADIKDSTIESDDYADGSIDHEHLAADVISGLTEVTSVDADYMIIWDATDSALKKCDMGEVRGGGSATAYDDIGDPDAAASISFDDGETATYTGANDNEVFFTINLSAADLTGDTTALKISAVDDDDTNYIPLLITDDSGANDDELFKVDYAGNVYSYAYVATSGITSPTITLTTEDNQINGQTGERFNIQAVDGRLDLVGDTDVYIKIDGDNDGSENFKLLDGAASTILDISEAGAWTILANSTLDFGNAASFEIPNADAPTVDAAGELALDTNITDHNDLLTYFDSDAGALFVVAIPSAQLGNTDDYVVAYDADNDRFYMKQDADTGGATAYDDIGDPDAAGSISFDDTETATYVTATTATDFFHVNASGAFGDISIFKVTQDTGNPTDGTLIEASTADAEDNVDQLLLGNGSDDYVTHHIVEAGTYTIDVTSDGTAAVAIPDPITANGGISSLGTIEAATLTEGGVGVPNVDETDWVGSAELADEDWGDVAISGGAASVEAMTANDATTGTYYVGMFASDTGNNLPIYTDAALNFTQATGTLAATVFSGSGASLTSIDISTSTNLTAGDHITLTDDDLDVDDDFLLNTGDVGTGDYDFGGADLELPQGQTPDTDGDIDLDFTDGSVVIQHGSAHAELGSATDVVVGKLIHSFSATLAMPDLLQAEIDNWPLKSIESTEFPHGIVVTDIYLKTSASSSYSLNVENWDDPTTINGSNGTIDAIATSTSTEVTEDTITYSTIAAGQIIMLDLDTDDLGWIYVSVEYYEPIA